MRNPVLVYPCNLISRVLEKSFSESELPPDIDVSISYAFSLLSEPHGECMLMMLFEEGLTRKEIAAKMQCAISRVNAIFSTSMTELSLGNRPMLFTHGYSYCCENRILGPWLVSMGKEIEPDIIYDLPVYDLGVDMRAKNNLNRGGIYTVGELINKTEDELLRIRNMGAKSVTTIKDRLAEMGLSLLG